MVSQLIYNKGPHLHGAYKESLLWSSTHVSSLWSTLASLLSPECVTNTDKFYMLLIICNILNPNLHMGQSQKRLLCFIISSVEERIKPPKYPRLSKTVYLLLNMSKETSQGDYIKVLRWRKYSGLCRRS